MSRYPIRNVNWRDNSTVWTWHELYQGWLSLAEQHRREERCKPARSCGAIELVSPPK